MGSELQYLTQTTENVSLLTCNETFTTLSASRTSTVIFSPRWDRWKHRTLERCGWSINYSQDDSRERESRKEHSRFGKYGSIRIIDCKWGVIFTTPEEAKEEFKGNRVGIIGVNEIRDIGKSFFFFFFSHRVYWQVIYFSDLVPKHLPAWHLRWSKFTYASWCSQSNQINYRQTSKNAKFGWW